MIPGIEKLSAELEAAFLLFPTQRNCLGKRKIEIRLTGAVYDAGSTIPECSASSVCADDGRSCKQEVSK